MSSDQKIKNQRFTSVVKWRLKSLGISVGIIDCYLQWLSHTICYPAHAWFAANRLQTCLKKLCLYRRRTRMKEEEEEETWLKHLSGRYVVSDRLTVPSPQTREVPPTGSGWEALESESISHSAFCSRVRFGMLLSNGDRYSFFDWDDLLDFVGLVKDNFPKFQR